MDRLTKGKAVGLLLGLTLLASACSQGGDKPASPGETSGTTAPTGKTGLNDIVPTDRAELADGGTLRWALDQIPPNFNLNELDGSLADNASIMAGLMPGMFDFDAAAQPVRKNDYVTSAELTATSPKQVVTYRINPKAAWDDGTPITQADFEAQWKALRGVDRAFKIASSNGYEKIESVAKGADDREVIVTYLAPYVDWQGLFSSLYPASTNGDAGVFNDGWKEKPLTTAGPFRFEGIDATAKAVTLVRNEKWWGRAAKLDKIIFRAIDRDAQVDALANGEIDFIGTGSDVNRLRRAESTKGVAIHRSSAPNFNHLTINATSAILSDVEVRRALARAIDRDTIARALLGPLGVSTAPLGNHIFMTNQKGYQDNSTELSFSPDQAKASLEKAGWKASGATRAKDSKPLTLRLVLPSTSTIGKQIAELIRGMVKEVGITVDLETVPSEDFFEQYVSPGNFDLVLFSWVGTPFPISSAKSIYAKPKPNPDGSVDIQQNYARLGSDELDRLFDQATAEFDAGKAIDLGNQIDRMIWGEVHSLTIYQVPDIVATKATLANFGAFGFASAVYEDIGFKKT